MCYTGICGHEDRNGECTLVDHYDCPQIDITTCDCCGKDFPSIDTNQTTCGTCRAKQLEEYLFIIEDVL